MALWVFVVGEDGSVRRLPSARLDRLQRGEPAAAMPEYAGKSLRCAEAVVELRDRKPIAVERIVPLVLTFDRDGRLDPGGGERQPPAASATAGGLPGGARAGNVIDASHRFDRDRSGAAREWPMGADVVDRIRTVVLGDPSPARAETGDRAPGASRAAAHRAPADPPRFTAKEGQYLAYIYYYTKIHRIPPAESDMQRYFEVTPPVVHQMVKKLTAKGFIARTPRRPRSIRLLVERAQLPDLE